MNLKHAKLKVELLGVTDWTLGFVATNANDPKFEKFDFRAEDATAKICEFGGRLCYMSFERPRPGGATAYIENILKQGHGSVLEHANFTFYIQGVSRTLTHELVRHRAGAAYSQLSQRFVDPSINPLTYVVPPLIEKMEIENPGLYIRELAMFDSACLVAEQRYMDILADLKAALSTTEGKKLKETARSVLPNCTETKILCTWNARALRHILAMRGSLGADAEIRRLALALYAIVKNNLLFMDFSEVIDVETGITWLNCKYPKV